MYNELLHVPLIVINPKVQQSKRIEQLVRLIDVYPTVLDILGFNRHCEFMDQRQPVELLTTRALVLVQF